MESAQYVQRVLDAYRSTPRTCAVRVNSSGGLAACVPASGPGDYRAPACLYRAAPSTVVTRATPEPPRGPEAIYSPATVTSVFSRAGSVEAFVLLGTICRVHALFIGPDISRMLSLLL